MNLYIMQFFKYPSLGPKQYTDEYFLINQVFPKNRYQTAEPKNPQIWTFRKINVNIG